ncbi:3'(2'),5'-bisphosphate nucleotidase CysQ [Nitrincola sp.]|uniref:3'(2'),5'-bisphosphate nucleotidase CysQ n=1 Tax=Nitrincola sp. TaxID=1926584 RepID=UPI003A911240
MTSAFKVYDSTITNESRMYLQLLPSLKQLACEAGDAIMHIYQDPAHWNTQQKSNDTPVTAADLAAHKLLVQGLQQLTPDIPILSEEADIPDWQQRQHWSRYWLLDPLDGTREFLSRNGEFTVNIALIEAGQVQLGLVYAPDNETLYWGSAATGAWKSQRLAPGTAIHTRSAAANLTLLTSRRHSQHESAAIAQLLPADATHNLTTQCLGSSLKLCRLAEGKADLYLRLSPTSEWDTAAGQAILEAAGGELLQLPELTPLPYNSKDSLENPGFIASGQKRSNWRSISLPD